MPDQVKGYFSQGKNSGEPFSGSVYEIRVKGCTDEGFWNDWFGCLEIQIFPEAEETLLRGGFVDQAELYGLLSRLRNKGMTLISVLRIPEAAGGLSTGQEQQEEL